MSAIAAVGEEQSTPFESHDEPKPYDEVLDSFVDVEIPETSAVLAVAAATHPDELKRARFRREVVERRHDLPGWLRRLEFFVTGVERLIDRFGDTEDVMLGVRVGRNEFTLIVVIDHQAGSVVKDAFSVNGSFSDVLLRMRSIDGVEEFRFVDADRADIKAKLVEAIEHGAMLWPPFESEEWPRHRPLLRWVLASMPDGGASWEHPDWSDEARSELADAFIASPEGRSLSTGDTRSIVGTLIWLSADYPPGDPLIWSPRSLEAVLLDRVPRKIVADQAYLDAIPAVLAAFIQFVHERSDLDQDLKAESMDALGELVPEYLEAVRAPRRQGPEALLERMGALPPLEDEVDEFMTTALAATVGGEDVLNHLAVEPLTNEEFDATGIDEDIQSTVAEVGAHLDAGAVRAHGFEFRTACRRLLRDAAVGNPSILRRKAAPARTAAAIAWLVADANLLIGFGSRGTAKDLLAAFGVSGSVSERASKMHRAASDRDYGGTWGTSFGHTRYLTSVGRANIVEARDRFQALGW